MLKGRPALNPNEMYGFRIEGPMSPDLSQRTVWVWCKGRAERDAGFERTSELAETEGVSLRKIDPGETPLEGVRLAPP